MSSIESTSNLSFVADSHEVAVADRSGAASGAPRGAAWSTFHISLHRDLAEIEAEWRALEVRADATAFQSYDWIATWQRCIGAPMGTLPAILLGRDADGTPLFIFALSVSQCGRLRRLTWIATDLCDYTGPLLDRDFSASLASDRFVALWQEALGLIRQNRALAFDYIDLQRMPETIGGVRNPFVALPMLAHPSGAHAATLGTDWERYYAEKRSASTRKTARKQFKHLAAAGAVRFVDSDDAGDRLATIDVLMAQKAQSLARIGVDNIFDRPGYRDFFHAVASDPKLRRLVRISKLDVGETIAATSVGLAAHGTFFLILASYDGGPISQHGPGRAHLHELLRDTIEKGFTRFDFTVGDEPYKFDWCDVEIRLYDYLAANSFRGWRLVQSVMLFRRVKRLVKQTPFLWRIYQRLRAAFGTSDGHRDSDTA